MERPACFEGQHSCPLTFQAALLTLLSHDAIAAISPPQRSEVSFQKQNIGYILKEGQFDG